MGEWVLYVMTWAAKLSGYPFPDTLPHVQFEPESGFSHRVCTEVQNGFTRYGINHLPCKPDP